MNHITEITMKIKMIIYGSMIVATLGGCTVNHYTTLLPESTHPVVKTGQEKPVLPPPPPPPPQPSGCQTLYDTLKTCHAIGKGRDSNDCAELTVAITEELRGIFPNDPETVARFGLMCGTSCVFGTSGTKMVTYQDFSRETCN